jgi:lipopolysaccharide export system ATP-binding protein
MRSPNGYAEDDEPSLPWLGQGPRLVADNRGLVGRGLGKSFKRRPVLRDVNVSVQRGEVVG